jgi:hypothetical protein
MNATDRAHEGHRRLSANANRYHRREIEHEEFSATNARIWAFIQTSPKADDLVCSMLRGEY